MTKSRDRPKISSLGGGGGGEKRKKKISNTHPYNINTHPKFQSVFERLEHRHFPELGNAYFLELEHPHFLELEWQH